MLQTDPIHETEHVIADEISALALRVVGCSPSSVQVHLRDDTIVYLLEGTGILRVTPAMMGEIDAGLDEIIWRALGRRLAGPVDRTRVPGASLLVVLRLGPTTAGRPAAVPV